MNQRDRGGGRWRCGPYVWESTLRQEESEGVPDQGPFHTRFRSHSAPSPASPLPPPPSPPRKHDRPPDSSFSRHQALPRASPISLPPPPPGLPACQNPRLGKRDMDTAISALFLSAACLNLPSVFSILHLAPPVPHIPSNIPPSYHPLAADTKTSKPPSPIAVLPFLPLGLRFR